MKRIILLLTLFAAVGGNGQAAPGSPDAAKENRLLLIDPSSVPVAAGKATLTIGALQRTNGVYTGDYKLKVFPYFVKNDKGRLTITVSDAALAKVSEGKVAAVTGTATSGKSGRSRHIEATATPADGNHGTLKLSFIAGNRKMIFEPAYHFAETATAAVWTPAAETNLADNLPRPLPVSPPETREVVDLHP